MGDSAKNNNVIRDRFPEKRQEQINIRTNHEKIILYLQGKLGNAKLSPKMEERLARLKTTADLIEKHGNIKDVLPILMDRYDISPSSARRMYQEAQEAYGAITHFNRQYHIDTYVGMLLKGAKGAKESGDWKSYAAIMRQYESAIEKFMGTDDAAVYQKIQIPDFKLGYFPEELKVKREPNWEAKLVKLKEDKYREIEEAVVINPDEEDTL